MSIETIKTTVYRLYLVTFPDGDDGNKTKREGYFSSELEAKKVADLKRGCWGAKGNVRSEDFKTEREIPSYWITAREWARNNMTVSEYENSNFR